MTFYNIWLSWTSLFLLEEHCSPSTSVIYKNNLQFNFQFIATCLVLLFILLQFLFLWYCQFLDRHNFTCNFSSIWHIICIANDWIHLRLVFDSILFTMMCTDAQKCGKTCHLKSVDWTTINSLSRIDLFSAFLEPHKLQHAVTLDSWSGDHTQITNACDTGSLNKLFDNGHLTCRSPFLLCRAVSWLFYFSQIVTELTLCSYWYCCGWLME